VRNVFAEIAGNAKGDGEEVGGVFQCQQDVCFNIVEVATYYEKQSLLEWQCEEGHKNKIEGFEIG